MPYKFEILNPSQSYFVYIYFLTSTDDWETVLCAAEYFKNTCKVFQFRHSAKSNKYLMIILSHTLFSISQKIFWSWFNLKISMKYNCQLYCKKLKSIDIVLFKDCLKQQRLKYLSGQRTLKHTLLLFFLILISI